MLEKLKVCLNTMPAILSHSTSLKSLVLSPEFTAMLSANQFEQILKETGMSDVNLRLGLLPLACCYAYTPISHFNVGALARGLSGNVYFGANMEIPHVQLNQTLHAEQSSIAHAWSYGERGIQDLTINYSPCGHCRQFINELNTADHLQIQLPDVSTQPFTSFLPDAFGPEDLNMQRRLLDGKNNGFEVRKDSLLIQQACYALNKSYAPYSQSPAGVALESVDGNIFTGMYAENAAFNPSLPALQVALTNFLMAQYDFSQIKKAVLVETKQAALSNFKTMQSTLFSINPQVQVQYLQI